MLWARINKKLLLSLSVFLLSSSLYHQEGLQIFFHSYLLVLLVFTYVFIIYSLVLIFGPFKILDQRLLVILVSAIESLRHNYLFMIHLLLIFGPFEILDRRLLDLVILISAIDSLDTGIKNWFLDLVYMQ